MKLNVWMRAATGCLKGVGIVNMIWKSYSQFHREHYYSNWLQTKAENVRDSQQIATLRHVTPKGLFVPKDTICIGLCRRQFLSHRPRVEQWIRRSANTQNGRCQLPATARVRRACQGAAFCSGGGPFCQNPTFPNTSVALIHGKVLCTGRSNVCTHLRQVTGTAALSVLHLSISREVCG